MRILFYAWDIYDEELEELQIEPNGGSIAIRNIAEYVGRKCEVFLFIGKKKMPKIRLNHINIVDTKKYCNDESESWILTMSNAFEHVIKEIQPDFVNLHGGGELIKECILKCIELNVKYAYSNHLYIGPEKRELGKERNYIWEKEIFSIDDLKVTTVSTDGKKNMLRDYSHLKEQDIEVILNGTNFEYEIQQSNIVEKYNLLGKKVLLCIGTIIKRKNQIQIVRAFAKMSQQERDNIVVLFCGKDRMDGELQKEIEKYELNNNLIYLGTVPNIDIGRYYNVADGYILTSLAEGLSLTMLEAMVYGLPLIMFDDVEGASDLADDKVALFIHGKEDVDVVQSILKWADTEWDKKYIREYAKYFNMERVASDYIAYYNKRLSADNSLN